MSDDRDDDFAPRVRNQDNDPRYNREGGIVMTPGSAHQQEMAKFEQFPHSQWAFGSPGNPYRYRPFPKMVYHAERFNGKVACQVPVPERYEFKEDRAYFLAVEQARRFNEKNQRIVNDETEYARAMEAGWRESPQEAEEFAHKRDRDESQHIAHLNYEDRGLSESAKAEKRAAEIEAGRPLAEVPTASKRRERRAEAGS